MGNYSEINDSKQELDELKKRFEKQRSELLIAQKKRAGHYAKLEYQLKINHNLQDKIDDLHCQLQAKNKDFLNELIKEKYGDFDRSLQEMVERYNNEILISQELRAHANDAMEKNTDLLEKLSILEDRFKVLESELQTAQTKRSGHYEKLVRLLDANKKLEEQIANYKQSVGNHKYTLTWLLGDALLQCKTFSGILKLPFNIVKANQKFRSYKKSVANKVVNSINTKELNIVNDNAQNDIDISILGWPKPDTNQPITIMAVADQFTTSNLKSVANLITPRPDNWRGLLERDSPSLLFVESAWNGNQNSWQYRIGSYANSPGKELFQAIEVFKHKKIPTVFWNKEDPVHFDKFKGAAKDFDYIFTSDEGCIAKYEALSNAKVLALPFAADGTVNNPIGSINRLDKVCFAGSYYANRFIERQEDQLMLLESALPYGLDIFDRNAGNANKDFHFPEQFKDNIKGALAYDEMNQTYKKYKVFLNVNSVIDSKTMFSRRVFELLASGTPIVSTASLGIEEFFGNDLVWMVKNRQEAQEAIHTLLTNDQEWRQRSLQGIRSVFMSHTFQDRFQFVLENIGLITQERNIPNILLCFEVKNSTEIDFVKRILSSQESGNKFNIIPLVILRDKKLKIDLPCIVDDQNTMGYILNKYMLQEKNIQFISTFCSKHVYGKYYLLDLYLATLYANADIITKPQNIGDQYTYMNTYSINNSLFTKSIFNNENFWKDFDLEKRNLLTDKLKVFAIDSANFLSENNESIENALRKIEV